MKIAFFSDIHANLPALQAFFEDLEKVQPDMIYCLGDLVGYNIWANEVVDEIRKRHIPTLMGNHDEALINPPQSNELSNRGITSRIVTSQNRQYLINLPRHLKLSFQLGGEQLNMLLVHGSPKSISDYLVENYPEEEVLDMMAMHSADIILCGHTHKPYHRIIGQKHVINIGSVGKPKDGDPRLCYAVLEFGSDFSINNIDSLKVEFRRRAYDVDTAIETIHNSDFPNEFADALRLSK